MVERQTDNLLVEGSSPSWSIYMKDYIKHLYNIKDNESSLILIPNNKTILRKEEIKPSKESKKIYKRKSKLLGLNISLKGRLKGARRARRLVHN